MSKEDFIKWDDGTYSVHERILDRDYLHKSKVKEAINKVITKKEYYGRSITGRAFDDLKEELGLK